MKDPPREAADRILDRPSVSVLLAVLDEAASIEDCLRSLAAQDYRGIWELIVAEGGSTDGTRSLVAAWQDRVHTLKIIDNPGRIQTHGLNAAAARAQGEILVRADGHTTYASDYLTRSVRRLLDSDAVAVGGLQQAEGSSVVGRAVAAAMRSPLAVGPAPYRQADSVREADTVYLGCFRRSDYVAIGGFRTLPSQVAEDADFYFRIRSGGGKVLLDPSIRSTYRPRDSLAAVARQYYRYGLGKADLLYINGRWPSWRPLGPTLLLVALLATMVVGLSSTWIPMAVLVGVWLLVLLVAGGGNPLVAVVAAVMQLGYGVGLLRGLLRSPRRVRTAVTIG